MTPEEFEEYYVPEPNTGCWLWARSGQYRDGAFWYGQCWIRGRYVGAHRVSWTIHRGPIQPGLHILHKCDTPACVNPDHLQVGTTRDNVHDAVAKGRNVRGERCPWAKLSRQKATEVRRLYAQGMTKNGLARAFGVTQKAIVNVLAGVTWKEAS